MYRFQVSCETQWGEELCVVGSAPCLGAWDLNAAIALNPDAYPVWKSRAVDVSRAGPKMEYKYVKRTCDGPIWEPGSNRWVPIEVDAELTVDGGSFGVPQPEPLSFTECDDRPQLHVSQNRRRIVVVGSSVAEGHNAWRTRGWAWLLGQALGERYDHQHQLINVSHSGANTQVARDQFQAAVLPWKPDVVIVALSLENEGLAHCPRVERRAAQYRFEEGILKLLRMVVNAGAVPMLAGVYPNNDFDDETYGILRETAKNMKTWGVPIFDWLDALDDGRGRWREGLWFDHAHPNSEGHRRMFESIDLSLFDKASIFDDGRGFSVVLCEGALNIRNKTRDEYVVCADWRELCCAMAACGLRPGTYICSHGAKGLGTGNRALLVDSDRRVANRIPIPPGTDAVFLASIPLGLGRDGTRGI